MIVDYAAWMREIFAPLTAALRMQHILRVVVPLAPGHDWSWLKRLARRMETRAVRVRTKRDKLIGVEELYGQGAAMMAEAVRSSVPDWRDAQHFRDGLMLCFLASRPLLRRRAEAPPPTDRLWISRNGTPMEQGTIYSRIITLTCREFGMRINQHLFRDTCATSVAIEDPEHVRMVMALLGHTTLTISEKHYNQSQMVDASRRHNKAMGQTRQEVMEWGLNPPDPTRTLDGYSSAKSDCAIPEPLCHPELRGCSFRPPQSYRLRWRNWLKSLER